MLHNNRQIFFSFKSGWMVYKRLLFSRPSTWLSVAWWKNGLFCSQWVWIRQCRYRYNRCPSAFCPWQPDRTIHLSAVRNQSKGDQTLLPWLWSAQQFCHPKQLRYEFVDVPDNHVTLFLIGINKIKISPVHVVANNLEYNWAFSQFLTVFNRNGMTNEHNPYDIIRLCSILYPLPNRGR